MRPFKFLSLIFLFFITLVLPAPALDSFQDLKLDVKKFRLTNGMLFLVVERHTTPKVACHLAIRAGSSLEQTGKTGIAHMLEHMLFKGTKNFGSLDYIKDQELQDKIEAAYQAVLEEQLKRSPNQELINARLAEMEKLRRESQAVFIPQVFATQLSRNGGININAHTSPDQTWYTASMPADMLEQWFSIASEQVFEPAFREFYVEKEIVQREWGYRYTGNPAGAAWLDLNTLSYTAHPYGHPVIGWESDIGRFNTWDAIAFHKKYYNPNNAVCVLVGDVTLEKAREWAETYFGRYIKGDSAPEKVTAEPVQQGPRRSIRFLNGARNPLVRLGYHSAPMGAKDFYALDVLDMLMSFGRSGRLVQNLLNKGLVQEAWSYNSNSRFPGLFILGGSPLDPPELQKPDLDPGQKIQAYLKACEELEALLLLEVEKFKSGSVAEKDLKRIKKLHFRDTLRRMQSNEDLADWLATLEIEIGWQYAMDYAARIDEITPQDIQSVAIRYLDQYRKNTVYVIPGQGPEMKIEPYEEIRTTRGAGAAKPVPPAAWQTNFSVYPTPPAWKHPLSFKRKPRKIQYPQAEILEVGKTTLFYLPDRELPLIHLNLLVKAGSVDLADNQVGLGRLLERCLIAGGTQDHSPEELAGLLDENAIHISASIEEEKSTITLSVLKEDWEKGLAFLTEILTRPRFDPEILAAVKNQLLTELKREGGDAETVAGREVQLWHFKGHPYGRDPLLGLNTLPLLTGQDLLNFLQTYFLPENMVISVAGDVERERVVADLQKFVQLLPRQGAPGRKLSEPPQNPPVLALIHKPGQSQSQIFFTLPGMKRTHPDYWKMDLLMNVLGGVDSLLSIRLREELGLVYGAGFIETYRWQAGFLIGYASTRSDMTGEILLELVQIMNRLRTEVPAENMEQKRLDALNSFVFNIATPAELVDVYGGYYLRGEDLNTPGKIQDDYINAGKKDLEALAKKWLDPLKLQIVIVADKTTPVKKGDNPATTLEQDLQTLAQRLQLPYRELPLR